MTKMSQQTAAIRYTDYLKRWININLRIYNSGDIWDMDISALGQERKRIPVNITVRHLGQLNERLRQAMGNVMHHTQGGSAFTKIASKTDLTKLAEAGNLAFMEIFGKNEEWRRMQKLFSYARNITIEVNSERFFIPWELLYSDSLDKPAYENFWGMKYNISRIINQDQRPGDIEDPTIFVNSRPKVSLFAFKSASLPNIAGKEIPFFNKLKTDGKITLRELPGLDPTPNNKDSELIKFKKFLKNPFHVAHFACHAQYDEKQSVDSFIQLSNGIRISLYDLAKKPQVAIKNFPLIILNACKTGQTNPMDVHFFAADFIKYGALGVIATESAVPDILAADFTRHLYAHLLKERYLGESVLLARQELLKRNNPVGLLYALYAPSIIRLWSGKKNRNKKITRNTTR